MESKHGGAFGQGLPNDAYAKYFIGNSYLNQLTSKDDYIQFANVTFEPSCRNNWHIHHTKYPVGQILICVDGEGWYQEEGKEARRLKTGDIVEIPSNVKHWHGATKDGWFSHIAFSLPDESATTEWCEEVSAIEYNKM